MLIRGGCAATIDDFKAEFLLTAGLRIDRRFENRGVIEWWFNLKHLVSPMTDVLEIRMNDLSHGLQSRFIETENGLNVHLLEAGSHDAPLVLLLHGFPELAYSWRRLIKPIADLGFHVVAPDQRGYGKTTGSAAGFDVDLTEFGMVNLAQDVISLAKALDHDQIALLAGHDFGSPVAAWTALMHPAVIQNVILMSSPFAGPPKVKTDDGFDIHRDLAQLPSPRKHYQKYFGEREAETHMLNAPCGFRQFLRAYFHCKSADWSGNQPHPLSHWSATEIARMPRYYIMDLDADMAQTAISMAPSQEEVDACHWLEKAELEYFANEFKKTGLQGGLNWYRRAASAEEQSALATFEGQKIQAPLAFIGGAQDWGVRQFPGALEAMEAQATKDFRGTFLIEGVGHWVQQEKPEAVLKVIRQMLPSQ